MSENAAFCLFLAVLAASLTTCTVSNDWARIEMKKLELQAGEKS